MASAMIGGADAVYSNNYLVEKSTDNSEEISFKQQIVLAYESIINVFEDASNGSYYIEDITKQIADKSWGFFVEIEEKRISGTVKTRNYSEKYIRSRCRRTKVGGRR
ncbi:methylmalonyl-CoA mutase family protein [Chryseobacterium indoltheticum]|uniref:methylmalonyl-CoA mutase family protein n=1 Tax=Chryseobacterium indoltheticum TaxID=254 RepID=UPI003F499D00